MHVFRECLFQHSLQPLVHVLLPVVVFVRHEVDDPLQRHFVVIGMWRLLTCNCDAMTLRCFTSMTCQYSDVIAMFYKVVFNNTTSWFSWLNSRIPLIIRWFYYYYYYYNCHYYCYYKWEQVTYLVCCPCGNGRWQLFSGGDLQPLMHCWTPGEIPVLIGWIACALIDITVIINNNNSCT